MISKPIKNDASNYGINLKKIILQSSHNYFKMLHYGRRTHNNRALFCGFEGVIMGLIMGIQNIMGSDYGSNISVIHVGLQTRIQFQRILSYGSSNNACASLKVPAVKAICWS
jgi:hypothetical protein